MATSVVSLPYFNYLYLNLNSLYLFFCLFVSYFSTHCTKTKGVREYTSLTCFSQSTGVRGHTTESSGGYTKASEKPIQAACPVTVAEPTQYTILDLPILSIRESTMDSTVSERHIANGRDNLSDHSDLCWQNQPIQVELEGPNSGTMGHSNSTRGLSHSSLVCSPPTISTLQPSLVHRGCSNTGGGDTVPPAEAGHMSNFSPNRGVLFKYVHNTKERWGSETCHQLEALKQICEIRAFQDGGVTYSESSRTGWPKWT